jgi:hypothetical protein
MHRLKKNIPGLLVILVIFYACKKNDGTPPSVSIVSPAPMSQHNVLQYIHVKVDASDDKNIESITISIQNSSGVNVVSSFKTYPATASANISHTFHINDIHIPTGSYSIRVEAFDGTNSKTAFREIYLNEVQRALKRIMITRFDGISVYIDSLATNQFINFFNTPGDYSSAAISSWWQQIYLQGIFNSPLTAYQAEDMSPLWSVPAQPNGTLPYFNSLTYLSSSHYLYSSNGYGFLKAYNKTGITVENIFSPGGRLPFCATELGSYIITEHRDNVTGNHLLGVHNKGSGTLMQTFPVTFIWVKLESRGTDQIVLAGNNGNQGELRVYSVSAGNMFEPVNIPPGKVYDMVKIDNDNYLISHESGILKYTYTNSNLVNITTGNKAQCLNYDETLGLVLAAEGNTLSGYNPFTGAGSFSYTASDSIRNILLLFNK